VPKGQEEKWQFIIGNQPRRKILRTILEKKSGYLKQLSRDLGLSKRTVLIQLNQLWKSGILTFDWETLRIGETNRPVYLKVFKLAAGCEWLEGFSNLL
jgi:predicted transcriptional regulator